jgi:hypothetical protein
MRKRNTENVSDLRDLFWKIKKFGKYLFSLKKPLSIVKRKLDLNKKVHRIDYARTWSCSVGDFSSRFSLRGIQAMGTCCTLGNLRQLKAITLSGIASSCSSCSFTFAISFTRANSSKVKWRKNYVRIQPQENCSFSHVHHANSSFCLQRVKKLRQNLTTSPTCWSIANRFW